ncbi:hypothetical protein ABZ379_11925 [Streptomyces canus]|uniref:hypothetical protein n=1 Tax=Streptomyces canus TaxID=58343 RepID=UPI0033C3021D
MQAQAERRLRLVGVVVGNTPQAFSHVALVETAFALSRSAGTGGPAVPLTA